MGKTTLRGPVGRSAGFFALLLAGCSAVPGGTGFTDGAHRLLPAARELRRAGASPHGVPTELGKQPLPAYVLEPGDVVLVQPADHASPLRMPADQTVMPDGTIDLGTAGRLAVGGKTVREVEVLAATAVAAQSVDPVGVATVAARADKPAAVTVRVVSRTSQVFYVLGEVNAPGAFPLQGRETVLDAVLAAGGLTQRASADGVILSRPTRPGESRAVFPVCYPEIVQLGDTTTNYQIAPGDRVYVPAQAPGEKMFRLK